MDDFFNVENYYQKYLRLMTLKVPSTFSLILRKIEGKKNENLHAACLY